MMILLIYQMGSITNHLQLENQIKTMEVVQRPGVIINIGSASGLYPMYFDPIYSGAKGLLFVLLVSFPRLFW